MSLLPYYAKWGEFLSDALLIFHLYTSADVYAAQQHFFMFVTFNKVFYNSFYMILLCYSFFWLIHKTSPPLVSVDMLNFSSIMVVTPVDFSKGAVLVDPHISA